MSRTRTRSLRPTVSVLAALALGGAVLSPLSSTADEHGTYTNPVSESFADTYADQLHPGDAVLVRLGPGTDLAGSIASISPAVDKGTVTFFAILANDHHPGTSTATATAKDTP